MLNYYEFNQNNSGGSFSGPAHFVFVEAETPEEADVAAERVGVYFDGSGDCECCGQRWYGAYGKPETAESVKAMIDNEMGKLGGYFRKTAFFFLRNGFALYAWLDDKDESLRMVRVNVPGFDDVPNMLPEISSMEVKQLSMSSP